MVDITADTQLFCVLGNPVSHSKSPVVHNQAFADNAINAVYLAFAPQDIGRAVDAIRQLHIKGASITIPFKQSVMPHLDWIDEQARTIGAVNTIVNQEDRLLGYNTDSQAAILPLAPFGIAQKKILVIGAGGAARAVAFGIHSHKGCLTITNRSEDRGRELALAYGARFVPLDKLTGPGFDIIINTTAMGMDPNAGVLACPAACLTRDTVVMDVVYSPLHTPLISMAREKGCTVIDGLDMFVAQAAAQFVLWTGISPEMEKMRQSVLDLLNFQSC